MKIIIFLGLLGATLSAPLIPRHLLSASNSNELLLNLNNGELLPLKLQGPLNSWVPPFSRRGPLQQPQAPIPALPQISLSTVDQLVGLFPNEIPFLRQVSFAQGAQTGQLDPSQPQTPSQTQQGPNPVMPYVFPFNMPQEQAQTHQYYPVYMFLPWEQPQQTATQSPQQTGPQQFEEQIPFYAQHEYIPQPAETGVPGGQQQSALDPLLSRAPETVVMPAGMMPYLQNEGVNFQHDKAGVFMHSTSPKPRTANFFTTAIDPKLASELPEEKAMTDSLREP
ncbi:odontogenic ameloblast-associated protein [Fukomys damarensis]|uniref:odontogenic ameloblast-associated protein n=1 Tax=Fukomys damarensis TaxID=885580 RepID=UPI00053F7BB9|nr:odontogenic ameloblast-associated protein [Fukomys damarensis]